MSSQNKRIITDVKDNKEMGRLEIQTALAPEPPCKTCKKNDRRKGSAYCDGCAIIYRDQRFELGKVQRKIDEAKKSSNTNQKQKSNETNKNRGTDNENHQEKR